MKWFYKTRGTWRLLDDNDRWLGSVWGRKGVYFIDLPSDKHPFPLRRELGPHSLTDAKRLLVAAVVGERISR